MSNKTTNKTAKSKQVVNKPAGKTMVNKAKQVVNKVKPKKGK